MATERKHERMDEAELLKREAYDQNAAAREQAAFTVHSGPTTTGGHHMTGAAGTHPSRTHVWSATMTKGPLGPIQQPSRTRVSAGTRSSVEPEGQRCCRGYVLIIVL